MTLAHGEVVLERASRSFELRGDRGSSLKELVAGAGRRRTSPAVVRALDEVSLRVAPGETLGVVGRNGAGKSSTLKVLAGIIPLHSGRAECGGRVVSLLELGGGFGRDFTGRENIELNGALHGMGRDEIRARTEAIIAFSELGDFVEAPVRTYSSGMFVRLGFAIAAHLDADVMLIDEVLAVGDEAFQAKCMRRIAERIREGATLVLVSHDPGAIERICRRVVVLDAGRVAFDGPTADGLLHYHAMLGVARGAGAAVRPLSDRPVSVDEIELLDGAGRRRQVFRNGEALRVALALRARPEAAGEAPLLVLELRDGQGRRLFRTTTAPELRDGGARLEFEVASLPLLGGDYDLAAAALGTVERAAWERDELHFDRVVRFSVADEQDGEGIVDLRGSWRSGAAVEVAS